MIFEFMKFGGQTESYTIIKKIGEGGLEPYIWQKIGTGVFAP